MDKLKRKSLKLIIGNVSTKEKQAIFDLIKLKCSKCNEEKWESSPTISLKQSLQEQSDDNNNKEILSYFVNMML